jgi:CheY-like chemotaxis protein
VNGGSKGSREGRRKTVLIVEDDESIAHTLELTLHSEGYATVLAGDGTRALELLGQVKVDLVLSDLNMSPMHGRELLNRMKQDSELSQLPVIIVSGEQDAHAVEGVQSAIRKPFSVDELLDAVNRALQ